MASTDSHKKLIIANDALFDMLEEGERIHITVKGNSMLPFIRGDKDRVALVKATKSSLRKGRIVVARINEKLYYLHRIERVDGDTVRLRGDGNPYARETCRASSILAEAVELERNGKIYTPDSFAWKAAEKLWTRNPFLRRVFLSIYRRWMGKSEVGCRKTEDRRGGGE